MSIVLPESAVDVVRAAVVDDRESVVDEGPMVAAVIGRSSESDD